MEQARGVDAVRFCRRLLLVCVLVFGVLDFLPGTLMDISDFTDANKDIVISGGVPATSRPVLLGITKASLETNSF